MAEADRAWGSGAFPFLTKGILSEQHAKVDDRIGPYSVDLGNQPSWSLKWSKPGLGAERSL